MNANRPCPDVDATVLQHLQHGDTQALEAIYRAFERRVYTLALRLTGRPDSAEEVLQDAMLKMFERADQYRGDAPFWAWLRRLAVNECLMRIRIERRRPSESFEDTIADERGGTPWQLSDAATLERALVKLPDDTRAVLWLFHVEGYTHVEIAALFGRSASFSKSQLARGTRRLRALIDTPMEV
jgi:RNA polymerase sigma factor (sigma-70 family)